VRPFRLVCLHVLHKRCRCASARRLVTQLALDARQRRFRRRCQRTRTAPWHREGCQLQRLKSFDTFFGHLLRRDVLVAPHAVAEEARVTLSHAVAEEVSVAPQAAAARKERMKERTPRVDFRRVAQEPPPAAALTLPQGHPGHRAPRWPHAHQFARGAQRHGVGHVLRPRPPALLLAPSTKGRSGVPGRTYSAPTPLGARCTWPTSCAGAHCRTPRGGTAASRPPPPGRWGWWRWGPGQGALGKAHAPHWMTACGRTAATARPGSRSATVPHGSTVTEYPWMRTFNVASLGCVDASSMMSCSSTPTRSEYAPSVRPVMSIHWQGISAT